MKVLRSNGCRPDVHGPRAEVHGVNIDGSCPPVHWVSPRRNQAQIVKIVNFRADGAGVEVPGTARDIVAYHLGA